MIDIKLYSLLKVAELGSFTRAAESLSLTQPAVSQHVHSIESELGVRIFERASNRLHITREGEIVLKYTKRMLAMESNLRRELNTQRHMLSSLTIGITHTAESNAIAETLAEYATHHDGINLKMLTDTVANLYDMLRNYELDFAIVEGKPNDSALASLMLDSDSLVCVVSPESPLARQQIVTLSELKNERLILRLPDSSTRNLFVSSLESHNMSISDFNVIMEINNIATIKDLIRRDFGISVLPRSTCLDELKKKKIAVLPIENLSMIRETNIVYRRDFEHQELLQELVYTYNDMRRSMDVK